MRYALLQYRTDDESKTKHTNAGIDPRRKAKGERHPCRRRAVNEKREMYVVTAHVVTMPTIIMILVHICFFRTNCQVIVIFIFFIFCVLIATRSAFSFWHQKCVKRKEKGNDSRQRKRFAEMFAYELRQIPNDYIYAVSPCRFCYVNMFWLVDFLCKLVNILQLILEVSTLILKLEK